MFIVVATNKDTGLSHMFKAADTRRDAAEEFYLFRCADEGVDPEAEYAESAWHEELIDCKVMLETIDLETPVDFDAGRELVEIREIPASA